MSAFAFRPIARSDFALLSHWLGQPHVARWWADDPSPEALEADYGPNVDGREPSEVCIASHEGRPFGLVQRFAIDAYPQYADALRAVLEVPAHAWSIDYLVGEGSDTGRGLGTAMIAAWTRLLWDERPAAASLIVPVHAENRASWRALERNGYLRVCACELEPDNPADTRHHFVYRLDRSASSASRNARTLAGTSLRPGSSA